MVNKRSATETLERSYRAVRGLLRLDPFGYRIVPLRSSHYTR